MYDHGVYGQASSGMFCGHGIGTVLARLSGEHKYYFYSTLTIARAYDRSLGSCLRLTICS